MLSFTRFTLYNPNSELLLIFGQDFSEASWKSARSFFKNFTKEYKHVRPELQATF